MIVDHICSMDVAIPFTIGGEGRGSSTLTGSDRDPCVETAVNLLPLLRHIWWKLKQRWTCGQWMEWQVVMRLDAHGTNGIVSARALSFPGGITVVTPPHDQGDLSDDETGPADAAALEAYSEALLTEAYVQYSAAIHSYAFRLLGNQEDADDVTQEAFIRVHYRLEQLRDAARLRPWLYRIATNLCMDHLRKRARTRKIFGLPVHMETGSTDSDAGSSYDVAQPGSTAAIDGVAERDVIVRTLRRMAPKYAACLILHSAQGLNYREIADVLGISPGAAAVRLARARDMFGRYYEEQRDDFEKEDKR
jgi:RNA polymerase sigma-70 factor, ECF subfamily